MSGARQSPEQLIKQLIQYWATSADGRRRLSFVAYEHFYYKELAPSLVCNPDIGTATEQKILQELRAQLSPNEWEDLPKLIQQLRPEGSTFESENERRRREAQEAQQRDDEERERIRQEQVEKQRAAYLQGLRVLLKTDFLSADRYFEESCSEIITEQEFETEKVSFVKSWLEARASSTHGPQHLPDDEQIAAIAAVRGHIQLIARAGSGKTSTLVHRALFLLTHCRVPATQILILAFNRKAALEVRRRLLALIDPSAASAIGAEIHRRINDARAHRHVERSGIEASAIDAVAASLNVTLPHIMTFHALGYAIVHPEEGLLYNEAEGGAQGLSRAFQQVIDDHLQVPAFQEQIRDLMLAHFREDWEHIVEGRYDQSQEDFLRFRRSLPHESISGEYVKSYGEKVIADVLFEHDIAYRYERNHWWGGVNYRPDFTVFTTPTSGLIIEYFGLSGDPDYDEMSEGKRAYWKAKGEDWTLIEYSPADIARNGAALFRDRVKGDLEAHGVRCTKLSENEIWSRVRNRAIDRFTTASVSFAGRCRKQSLSPDDLRDRIDSYSPLSPVEGLFIEVAHRLYTSYLERLSATGEDDFDGLMQRAAEAVDSGITNFQQRSCAGDLEHRSV